MKRSMFFVPIFALMLAISCFAVGAGVGVRSMGMGGTGIATANDITAAYFNPAGLMFGPENFECQTFAGGATQGLTGLLDAVSSGTDFITNHFSDDYDLNATVSGGLGISVKKVGLSVIADGVANFNKPANALSLKINGNVNGAVALTLGSSFATPGLPFASMAVGVNLKSITVGSIYTSVVSSGAVGVGNMSSSMGSGFGFDIGAAAKITPLISVGAVIRNLSASTLITTKSKKIYVTPSDTTEEAETTSNTTYTPPTEVGIGAGFMVPLTGTLIACDLDNYSFPDKGNFNKSTSYSDTHIGIEQGLFMNLLMLRAGYYTYGPTEDTFYTYGLGLNLGPANLGIAAANSTKDCINSVSSAQLGVAF